MLQHSYFGAHPRATQTGTALQLFLMLVLLALGYKVVSSTSVTQAEMEREKKTWQALAQAKAALINWSLLQGDLGTNTNPRPGNLPCPDRLTDPSFPEGSAESSCSSSGATNIGRLPWRTIGADDLRDADGERLWYVLSDNFRRRGLYNHPINSDTVGTLQLYAADGATLLTPAGEELAAIIFAPGAPLSGQNRSSTSNDVLHYLESAHGFKNASASGPFITGPVKDAQGNIVLNDRVITISARELIAAVEKRVLQEAMAQLNHYAAQHSGKYPNPANAADCSLAVSDFTDTNLCKTDTNACFGRFPLNDDNSASLYSPPAWFMSNDWARLLTYAVNKNSAEHGNAAECSELLNVNHSAKNYVLIAPGTAKSGQNRSQTSLLSNYLEDVTNNDAWNPLIAGQESFTLPTASSNDQIRSAP